MSIDSWLLSIIACPYDSARLERDDERLICTHGHSFPIVDGIPVLLRDDTDRTHPSIEKTLSEVRENRTDELRINVDGDRIDPVVQKVVSATCGRLYAPLIGKLTRYPIPRSRLAPGNGATLLDIGCNWGRWTISAARNGYRPVGIDSDLGPVLAAKRITQQLGVSAQFVVGDARKLPFINSSFENVFSYSVIQHFSKSDARAIFAECSRVVTQNGTVTIQMPNKYGARNVVHQLTHRRPSGFDVRYWSPGMLRSVFEQLIGPARLSVDGFFGLGIQPDDVDLLPFHYRLIVKSSELLRKASQRVAMLGEVADSVYVTATKKSS